MSPTHETGPSPRSSNPLERSGTAVDETLDKELERPTLPAGTVLAGRYKIEQLIGEGGMGDVYLAQHLTIDKSVAVKVLAPEQVRRPRIVHRFLQEARAASKIRHDNVVDITDFGDSDGLVFFVMEYLDGEDLSHLLKREERLPWSRARGIVLQLLDALAAAHRAGIVHRDIKPHNCVFATREGRTDFLKVIDFGIAKLRNDGSGEQLTRTGAIVGTAEYMSPEQGSGAEIDGRSDLYSVGVILYRMLTGKVPFSGSNPMGILYQHIHAVLQPASQACPDAKIGPELDALCAKALAKDREQRFADAEAFAVAVRAIDESGGRVGVAKPRSSRGLWIGAAAIAAIATVAVLVWPSDTKEEPTTVAAATTSPTDAKAEPPAKVEPPAQVEAKIESAAKVEPPPPEPAVEASAPAEATPATDALPAQRSGKALKAALRKVEGKVAACGKQAGLFPGESVTVAITIAPSGKVSAEVKGAFSSSGARCIAKAIRSAKYQPAAREQSFDHVFTM
ncbi:MAG TPA: serine/threonine-protein kinase [Nannocystaceae bacterium]|nr:serine/threonine-protein kinase [Nannocystaceae bacterium]